MTEWALSDYYAFISSLELSELLLYYIVLHMSAVLVKKMIGFNISAGTGPFDKTEGFFASVVLLYYLGLLNSFVYWVASYLSPSLEIGFFETKALALLLFISAVFLVNRLRKWASRRFWVYKVTREAERLVQAGMESNIAKQIRPDNVGRSVDKTQKMLDKVVLEFVIYLFAVVSATIISLGISLIAAWLVVILSSFFLYVVSREDRDNVIRSERSNNNDIVTNIDQ